MKAAKMPRARIKRGAAKHAAVPATSRDHDGLTPEQIALLERYAGAGLENADRLLASGDGSDVDALLDGLPPVPPKPKWDARQAVMARWLRAMIERERAFHDLVAQPSYAVLQTERGFEHVAFEPDEAAIAAADELNPVAVADLLGDGATLLEGATRGDPAALAVLTSGRSAVLTPRLLRWVRMAILEGQFEARKKRSERSDLLRAADDTDAILRLWKDHYGKKNRAKGLATAADIAASWYPNVGVPSLEKHLKKLRERAARRKRSLSR